MQNINKVAINSLTLYLNMGVTMVVTLLATRLVLQILGEESYGVYALISSVVAMFSFLNVAMAAGTQRFLSYSIGEGDRKKLKEIFYSSILIHLAIAVVICVLMLTCGFYFVNNILEISPSLLGAARSVLICMIFGILFTVVAVPYDAAMNAHEDIAMIAVINIIEALLKLGASVVIFWVEEHRLEVYAFFVLVAQFFSYFCKRWYSRANYEETHYRFHRLENFALGRSMLGFSGWNLIGAGCSIFRYQGVAVLLNAFFGLLVNTAYGVAQQVNGFIMFFAGSIVRPLRPQIIKNEGAGAHDRMVELAFTTSRITFLMMSLVIIPLYVNMPYVLKLWLHSVPDGVLEFCRAFLLIALVSQLTVGLVIALESVGKIRSLQMIVGSFHIVSLPVGYVLFRQGFSPYSIMYCIIAEECICVFLRIWIARKDAGVPVSRCFTAMLIPCVLTFVICYAVTFMLAGCIGDAVAELLVTTFAAVGLVLVTGYFLCLSRKDRQMMKSLCRNIMLKIRR